MQLTRSQNKRMLFSEIRGKIESGQLKAGEKLLPTKQLAEKYGIAIQTAQRQLNELTTEGLLSRTPGKGTFIAKKTSIHQGGVVGLVMSCRGDIWGDFTALISKKLQEVGVHILYIEAEKNAGDLLSLKKRPAIHQLIAANPMAIITRDSDFAVWLSNHFPNIQVVCLAGDRVHDFQGDIACPDMYQAGYLGTQHLIEHGRKRILFFKIKGADVPSTCIHRELQLLCNGYCQAIKEAGLQEIILVDSTDGLEDEIFFKEKLKEANPIDALLINYDYLASEFIQLAKEMRVSVSKDLAVVSMLNTPWANLFKLTSIDLHYDLIAKKCIEIILKSDAKKKQCSQIYKFKPELVIRQSCGCSLGVGKNGQSLSR